MDKARVHFNHELRVKNIPYKELVDTETLNIWFEQFCDAPKIPSAYLYRSEFLSNDEYAKTLKNNRALVYKIQEELQEYLRDDTLEPQYYINDITKTPIAEALYNISEVRYIFYESIYDNSTDRYREPKETAEAIIPLLEQLSLTFALAIVKSIEEGDSDELVFGISRYGNRRLSQDKGAKLTKMNNSLIQHLNDWIKTKSNNEPQPTTKEDTVKTASEKKRTKFIANEYALAYIFDLWANGEQIPQNRVEGGNAYNELLEIGKEKGFERPDTFYRAILKVCRYDLNSKIDLERISVDWANAVKTLSKDWSKVAKYLKGKGIRAE